MNNEKKSKKNNKKNSTGEIKVVTPDYMGRFIKKWAPGCKKK